MQFLHQLVSWQGTKTIWTTHNAAAQTGEDDMTEQNAPKRRGPKPKPVSEVKRNNFTFRMSDDLRAKVLALSEKSGRPMSEEVEARLVASFDQPALIDALCDRMKERHIAYGWGEVTLSAASQPRDVYGIPTRLIPHKSEDGFVS